MIEKFNMWYTPAEENRCIHLYLPDGYGETEPMTRNIMELESLVQQKGARTWLYHQQGGCHCEADWEIQVPTWMQFLWT